jgi:hypothetical protein
MNNELRRHLEKLTKPEQEQRLKELADKLGFAHPKILDREDPIPLDVAAYEEYIALKRILGCAD